MDHARKIGKPNKSSIWRKSPTCQPAPPCSCVPGDDPLKEDHRLVNWKSWLADRERRQRHLTNVLARHPIDLALNAHERVRGKSETCCLLQAARPEVTNQDKGRGNPVFWKAVDHPLGDEENDVIGQLSRDARNLPPDLTRVALPDLIKREKKLIDSSMPPSVKHLASKWECGDYLHTRLSELKPELEFLEAKKPEMEELIIIGKNVPAGEQEDLYYRNPVITVTPPVHKRYLLNDPDERLALKIQDREFILEKGRNFERLSLEQSEALRKEQKDKDEKNYVYSMFDYNRVYAVIPKTAETIDWSLNFETTGNEMCTRHIVLENKGVLVVNVYWRREPPVCMAFEPPVHLDSKFFFDKNYLTLLPGQKIQVPIWFRSEQPLMATETWMIITMPRVYPGKLRLRLWAVAHGIGLKQSRKAKSEEVWTYISCQVRDVRVRQVVDEIVAKATSDTSLNDVPYSSFFLESDVFRVRNPGYFYKSMELRELKSMHEEAVGECGCPWNLTLRDLKSQLLEIREPDQMSERLERFQQLSLECLRRNRFYSRARLPRELLVYRLLCRFVDEMEVESEIVTETVRAELDTEHENERAEEEEEEYLNLQLYREIFSVRVYSLLSETMDSICAAIDTRDYLSEDDDE